ncbi:dentin sialophosphoprotein-like [Clytia hemisphaerica]|uniref:Uncharacterized protein n=1 Tax=Clytia hemisphaerica TaxID=252671 RepID=A0A7M5X6U5_9CNID
MAQPTDAFDELSSRISKRKRSDSGIHNIEDLNVEESRAEHHFTRRHSADELGDSGRESADQMDTSTNSNSKSKKKKAGNFFKGFKNIFRKKSKRKSQDGEGSLQEQYKSRSQDDIMVGGGSGGNRNDDHLRRLNSDGSSLTSKRSKSPINQDDDNNSEKKNSLKDAQQYIRSSLRKLKSKKGDKNDLDTTVESMDSEPKLDTSSRARSTSSLGNSSFNDDFFSKTLAEESTDQFGNHSSAPVKLGDIKPTTPQIENTVAKDRIRVAPQNRRKPSRYRTGNAPPKPARSTSSFSFKEDSFLTKIDEDSDNFESRQTTNVSRHTSNVSRNSDWDSMPSYSRNNSEMTNRSSFDNTEPNFNDAVPKALRNKHSFSTADDFQPQKQRTMAQRSFSTNSRENVNRPKPPIKPPRSANSSIQSLDDNEDLPVKKFSLGELKSKLFYSESFGKNDDEKRISRDQVFGSRASIDEKEKSAPEKRQSYGYERESPGDNQTSSPEKRQSFGDKRESFGEKRQSFGEKRQSFGEKRLSSVDTTPVEENAFQKFRTEAETP